MTTKKKNKTSFEITDFQFLGEFVLVKPIRPEKKGRLADVSQYDDKPEFGEVISAGEKVTTIKEGDVVWFGKYSSELLHIHEQDYYVIFYEDVKGVLKHE